MSLWEQKGSSCYSCNAVFWRLQVFSLVMAATLEPPLSFILFHIILIQLNTLVTLLGFAFDTNQPLLRVLTLRFQPRQSTVVPPLMDCPIQTSFSNG